MVDIVSCRVHLHGFGKVGLGDPPLPMQPNWYIAMAVDGVTYVNISDDNPADDEGFFTYLLDPVTCTASDYQAFNTYGDWGAHIRLINYLQALRDGRSLVCL